jgi:hypothetical protein
MRMWTAALVIAATMLFAQTVFAHPTSSTFVIIRVDSRTVDVEITADGRALALTLEALTTGPAPVEVSSRAVVSALSKDLIRLSELTVDNGRRVDLRWIAAQDTPDRGGLLTVHLTGALPDGAQTLQWRSSCLLGAYPVAIASGSATVPTDAYEWLAGPQQSRTYRLDALSTAESDASTVVRLIPTGFRHIVPGGLDHMLFMLGLFLMAPTRRSLLIQVSTFTLAHSLTLALAVVGLVSAPAAVVEPLIAASIAWVAIENLFATRVSRLRLLVVFAFGLLHGLGFAGAMAQLGLSREHLAASLVGFNLGVELGQLTVIAAAALLVRALRLPRAQERRFVLRPASAAIAVTGLVWAIQRVCPS